MNKKVGVIGLGIVGEATVHSLKKYSSLITQRTSSKIEIGKICDVRPNKKKLAIKYSIPFTTKPEDIISDPNIDVVVELIGGIEPAKSIILKALKNGKDVVTANKALLAAHGQEIFSLAKKYGRVIRYEASVCGAIPLIKSISEGLVACEVKALYGILNGTTNYILHKMGQEKIDFSVALKQAQDKGFAESNPYQDVEGIDALNKLCILSYLCFGVWPKPKNIYCEGITKITLEDILYARDLDCRIKLLAVAKKEGDKLDLRVHPALVPLEHQLSDVGLAYNGVFIDTAPAGQQFFYGEGAGGAPTSSAVVSDIVTTALSDTMILQKKAKFTLKNVKDVKNRYYIRCMTLDKPGVLAKVATILAHNSISLASVDQKRGGISNVVPIVMVTHEATEANMGKAVAKINKMAAIKKPVQLIRMEKL